MRMITVKQNFCKMFSKEKYSLLVNSIDFNTVECSCGHRGCLVRHGYYTRTLKLATGTIKITILRVKCNVCGRTHAVLPDNIIPYSQIPIDIQKSFLVCHIGDKTIQEIMDSNPDITEEDYYRSRKKYRYFWKERLASIFHSVHERISDLIPCCFRFFGRQFMQIHRGINLLSDTIHIT